MLSNVKLANSWFVFSIFNCLCLASNVSNFEVSNALNVSENIWFLN